MGLFDFLNQPHFWWGWMFWGLGVVLSFPLAYGIRRSRSNRQLLRSRVLGTESQRLVKKESHLVEGGVQNVPVRIFPENRSLVRKASHVFINSRGALGYGGIIVWLLVVVITGFIGIYVWWNQNQVETVRMFELDRGIIPGPVSAEVFIRTLGTMISGYGWGFPVFFGLTGIVWSMCRLKFRILLVCWHGIVILFVLFLMTHVLDVQKERSFQIFRSNGSEAFFLTIPDWNGEPVEYGSLTLEFVQGSPWLGFFGFKWWILTDLVQYSGQVIVEKNGDFSRYRIEPEEDRVYSLASEGGALFDFFYRLLQRSSFVSNPMNYDLAMSDGLVNPGVVLGLSEGFFSIISPGTGR